ncbi:MAG: homoserine dehydrogenase, partial [Lachnospira sp.]|nr:homoserine dehydrogenase [Lachnospira sp.]
MAKIAVLGYGTVGSGVVEVLETNSTSIEKRAGEGIEVKYVLDLRDFPGDPIQEKIVHDVDVIINDNEIDVVVEVMGGIEPAFTFVKKALESGKSVCTSNKALVAAHGPELLAMAKERNLNFMFEASVGGGIPIIRPLNQSLTADEITQITGILNGTTNYILTKMSRDGSSYEEVLKEAQELGYAERNPEADVEGFDACRKIAILTSLAFGSTVKFEEIETEGITNISTADFKYAEKLGCVVKLLATSFKKDGKVYAITAPFMIDSTHPLYNVNDVLNGIYIRGNVIGDVMFFGAGAGKLPTASAVVADIVDCVKHKGKNVMTLWS